MDVKKTLSAVTGHVPNSSMLDIYARSEEECEMLLAELIARIAAEISIEKERLKATPKVG